MENATKALIIAGSILIAILLIAFGVRTFQSTAGTTEQTEQAMQTTEIATFNSKFTSFSGSQRGNKVRTLADLVIANNATNTHQVSINGKTSASDISTYIASSITNSATYNVSIGYANGYVKTITIS